MSDLDLIRKRILFDPRGGVGEARAVGAAARMQPIPWPADRVPKRIGGPAADDEPLPRADVLIVTYTAAEGHALADVLTPGSDTPSWTEYRNGWPALKALIVGHRAPSLESDCAGLWALTMIGDKRVIVMKSDLHPATDGPNLPIKTAWKQWITQCQPELVITTGTAGGVGVSMQLGDVVVAQVVRWNCQKQFKAEPWATAQYATTPISEAQREYINTAEVQLLPANTSLIPSEYRPNPLSIWTTSDIETTDFFAFDTSDDHYGLRKFDPNCGSVEMDDAALGLALSELTTPPAWAAVRNASDPGNLGGRLEQADKLAEQIYEHYGEVTSWGSAIACWALVAGMQ